MRLAMVAGIVVVVVVLLVAALRFLNPPLNVYQAQEWGRLGGIEKEWVALDTLPAFVPLSAAAGEDADFCTHWGFDFDAIREALEDGASRGASTISQQTAKNVFLWHGRSWLRKGLEAGFTVLIEAIWGKRRIIEVYLNVAEFDEGVFGIEAAAQHHFRQARVRPEPRTDRQADGRPARPQRPLCPAPVGLHRPPRGG